ncbi:hypothetical protein M6B38_132315 [Iris pallida]|uniref:Uncharacterized protein n=1 Tax=Iris pallida TaxID=29817 RepID=A0AAX6FIG5_IRIPA|nr:hypothetical protein M6B38_132315 [Iris pallida]
MLRFHSCIYSGYRICLWYYFILKVVIMTSIVVTLWDIIDVVMFI